jgi:hypothetical protein
MTNIVKFLLKHPKLDKPQKLVEVDFLQLPMVDGEWILFDETDNTERVDKIVEDFKILLKEYKNAGTKQQEIVEVFQKQLNDRNLKCSQILNMVAEYWDVV